MPGAPGPEGARGGIKDAAMLAIYGILQHRYGRHGDALEACGAAVRARPGYPPAHAGRARALAGLGRPGEALDAFCDAIACDPECAPAYADYALMVTRLGCHEDAVSAYEEAIRLAPDSGDVHAGHAFALAGAGRLEDALATCKRAVRLDPESAMAHAARGRVMAGMGRAGEALSAFERAVRLDGGSASAHAGRGMALESLGRHAEALSAYERAIGIDEYHELGTAGRNRTRQRASPDGQARAGESEAARGSGRAAGARSAGIERAMDPGHGSARGYIEYYMSHAPRDDGCIPRRGGPRSPPLTAEEMADMRESASSSEAVVMDGSEFVDMIKREAGTAERAGCGGQRGRVPEGGEPAAKGGRPYTIQSLSASASAWEGPCRSAQAVQLTARSRRKTSGIPGTARGGSASTARRPRSLHAG